MVVGIVSSDTLNDFAQKALQEKAVHFVPYAQLPNWKGTADELQKNIESITQNLFDQTDYPIDGIVVEVDDQAIKHHMGATQHHYRWQIAVKQRGATATTTVNEVIWQVGRTGNVTPVMEVTPVSLSGATIKRVTAHHAGMIKERRIGSGALIEVIRSGEVIPKLEKVIKPADKINLPETCPACDQPLEWRNDFLKCSNSACRAQIIQRIHHWFKTLGNADWFGIKTIEKLVESGYDSLEKIYAMTLDDYLAIGFGPVQSKNLAEAIQTSLTKTVEDWRFLAAFGISDLGLGESRKLLSRIKIEGLIDTSASDIATIHGFGSITSKSIESDILKFKTTLLHMLSLQFNLAKTPLIAQQQAANSPITGKYLVFTGKLLHANRDQMKTQAENLGAIIQTAVSRKTDYLICGEKVGAKKLQKAQELGIEIISESGYLEMIKPVSPP
jgi:DNA ligase (NAD+)